MTDIREQAARVAEEYPTPLNDLPMALAMRSVAAAIRALPDGWRDIAEAPRDGERCDLWALAGHRHADCFWSTGKKKWFSPYTHEYESEDLFSHFMAPASPAERVR